MAKASLPALAYSQRELVRTGRPVKSRSKNQAPNCAESHRRFRPAQRRQLCVRASPAAISEAVRARTQRVAAFSKQVHGVEVLQHELFFFPRTFFRLVRLCVGGASC